MKKPKGLVPGDTIAIVSPSWGGPSLFPHVYESGLKNLEAMGFNPLEYPTARMKAETLFFNPQTRAEDINKAFSDPKIKGIISSIGGTDSARILKYLDMDTIRKNPKFMMGYSDFTTLTTYLNIHGLVTFNGPMVMEGFSQFTSFPERYKKYLLDYLFNPQDRFELPSFPFYSNGYPSWGDVNNVGKISEPIENDGLHFIQGNGIHEGRLFGGCIEVLEMLKGTDYWPAKDFWNNRILFLETSEDKPSVEYIQYWLRNYGVMGVFDKISGILIGRPRDYSAQEKEQLEKAVTSVIAVEFGNPEIPIVCNVDFGHTDPQLILPLGVLFEIDCDTKKLIQTESAFEM